MSTTTPLPSGKRLSRILVTNDDGVDAPGIEVAIEVANRLADEVWVVAPEHDQSGASRLISIHTPLRLYEYGERRYGVSGSPSDCAIMGLSKLLRDTPPDLVLSGVNAGANISRETGYSGTVGAALTAQMLGTPAIALSQAWYQRHDIPWETSRVWLPRAIEALLDAPGWPFPFVPNINVPAAAPDEIAGIDATRQGEGIALGIELEERVDRRETPYYWLGFTRTGVEAAEDSDVAAMRRKCLSVTPVGLSMTHIEGLDALKAVFAK
jgi:5'-nucleotidase